MIGKTKLAWWFAASDVLPHGDGRKIVLGATHEVKGKIVPCENGLHASPTILQALQYAPGDILYRVQLSGTIKAHGKPVDKFAASKRTYLAKIDAEPLLREFARKCALRVIHLWDAPRVVKDYLETGDESLRVSACAATRDAAWAAAGAAARAGARDAAWAAAGAAARAATRDAARDAAWGAAWSAAWAAAWAAAWDAEKKHQRTLLEKMGREALKKTMKERQPI